MRPRRRVFLAGNRKTGSHSLLEVVPGDYRQDRRGTLDFDEMNRLLRWKSVDDLVAVLERTGPLIASEVWRGAGRVIAIEDAVSIAEARGQGQGSQGYCTNDPALLHRQLYLDAVEGFYPSKVSVARAAAKHGLIESEAFEDLRQWAEEDPEAMVAVEPVADLVLARNLCSLTLRIIANYQKTDIDDVLEASGFRHVRHSGGLYAIPLQHDAECDASVRFSWKWGENVSACKASNQLGCLIGGAMSGVVSIEMADGKSYLTIRDDMPQRKAAEAFIGEIGTVAADLSSTDGKPSALLGWDFSKLPSLAGNDALEPVFRTLFAAMVGTVLFRDGKIPVACKTCGNAFFYKPKGKRREYCSPSCRSAYSRKHA